MTCKVMKPRSERLFVLIYHWK